MSRSCVAVALVRTDLTAEGASDHFHPYDEIIRYSDYAALCDEVSESYAALQEGPNAEDRRALVQDTKVPLPRGLFSLLCNAFDSDVYVGDSVVVAYLGLTKWSSKYQEVLHLECLFRKLEESGLSSGYQLISVGDDGYLRREEGSLEQMYPQTSIELEVHANDSFIHSDEVLSYLTLEDWLEENNIQPEDLDEIVHDAASVLASNTNNEGVSGQISFLKTVAGWSEADIKQCLLSTSSSDG